MSFWDSSCIVPLVVEESRSRACRTLMRKEPRITTWALTPVEVASAVRRLERDRQIHARAASTALLRLDALRRHWTVVTPSESVLDRAIRLLAVHSLSAGDALQLAAAIDYVGDRPHHQSFVTADGRLAEAATRTGFDVTVPTG
jgi:predicted nucleic acid-binding protein